MTLGVFFYKSVNHGISENWELPARWLWHSLHCVAFLLTLCNVCDQWLLLLTRTLINVESKEPSTHHLGGFCLLVGKCVKVIPIYVDKTTSYRLSRGRYITYKCPSF